MLSNNKPLNIGKPLARVVSKKPMYKPVGQDTTIRIHSGHKKYFIGVGICFSFFAVIIIVALVRVGDSVGDGVHSLTSGHLHSAITEAHKAMQSARRVTDSLPLKEVVSHWGDTNKLIADAKIPWEELPEWRTLAENTFRTSTNMMKEHPEWTKELKESSENLKNTASPLAHESKEWRKSFSQTAQAYAQALMSLYAPKTPKEIPLEKKVSDTTEINIRG